MDIMNKVNELVEVITKNEDLMDNFKKEPVKVIKDLVKELDLEDEILEKLAKAVEGKINVDKAANLLGGLKKLF